MKRPIGITILSFFIFITSILSIKQIFTDQKLLFFGLIFSGWLFKVYYFSVIVLGIVIAYGLYSLKRWSFFIFFGEQIFYMLLFLTNMILVTEAKLISSGWEKIPDLVTRYRMFGVVVNIILFVLVLWILKYRKYFGIENTFLDRLKFSIDFDPHKGKGKLASK